MRVCDLAEKPREKALLQGVQSLNDAELLTLFIESGSKNASAFDLACRILSLCNGVSHLCDLSLSQLTALSGIKQAKAIRLLAAVELARRIRFSKDEEVHTIQSAKDVYYYLEKLVRFEKQEHFIALYLDAKHRVIHHKIIFTGSLNCSVVHPREVFKYALQASAACLIVAHNHPSGDPTPSSQDVEVTQILVETGRIMQLPLLDHVIVGERQYFSFGEAKML